MKLGTDANEKKIKTNMNNFAVAVSSLGVAIGVCILGYHVFAEVKPSSENLYVRNLSLVQILFRHGARNPTYLYNNDPYKNYTWPEGLGQLTNIGKTQIYNLGKKFRKKYSGFLPDKFQYSDIYVISSANSRTLNSAYVFLAGLYPPKNTQIWNNYLLWQPIPVYSTPRELDNMIALKRPCKTVDERYISVRNSDEINAKYKDLFSNLTKYANDTSIKNLLDLEFIYSTWSIEKERGLKLPDWVNNFFPEPMRQATCDSFKVYSYDKLLKRLRGGVLLSRMIRAMEMKASGIDLDTKMLLYSGHDLTVTALLHTLGFEECFLPDFGASVILELRNIPESQHPEVKLVYYNSSESEPLALKIPNCHDPCTLNQFVNITQHVVPVNWEEECLTGVL